MLLTVVASRDSGDPDERTAGLEVEDHSPSVNLFVALDTSTYQLAAVPTPECPYLLYTITLHTRLLLLLLL
jgi:hypothetical protein